jgi:small subunit ribosomal protein S4
MSPVKKPKHKMSRREGVDLFGTGGESLQRRLSTPPGMHGRTARPRQQSEYAQQLREKQKVKRMFGMREAQFKNFFQKARRSQGVTGVALLQLLERRLDNIIYRLGYARTRLQARQFVSHQHVLVDGKRVNIPSYLVEPGQEIQLIDPLTKNPDVLELAEAPPPIPGWLERNGFTGKILRYPERNEMDQHIDEQRIVEFYSR